MNKTALKKAILFALTLILLITYILQLVFTGRAKDSVVTLKKDIDYITIEKKNEKIRLDKINDEWKICEVQNPDLKYATEDYSVNNIISSVSSLHLLGTVSGGSTNRLARYGLDDESKICVKVYGKDKLLRTVNVGKNSSSGSQSYVQVDGKKSVMVADSALRTIFDKSLPSLRKKVLYEISSDSISWVHVKNGEKDFELLLSQIAASDSESAKISSQRTEWTIASPANGENIALDQGSVGSWIASLSSVNVSQWCESDITLPEGETDIELEIAVGGMIYSIKMFYEEDNDRYICSSNHTEGLFYMSKSSAENLAKDLNDLTVKSEIPSDSELQQE